MAEPNQSRETIKESGRRIEVGRMYTSAEQPLFKERSIVAAKFLRDRLLEKEKWQRYDKGPESRSRFLNAIRLRLIDPTRPDSRDFPNLRNDIQEAFGSPENKDTKYQPEEALTGFYAAMRFGRSVKDIAAGKWPGRSWRNVRDIRFHQAPPKTPAPKEPQQPAIPQPPVGGPIIPTTPPPTGGQPPPSGQPPPQGYIIAVRLVITERNAPPVTNAPVSIDGNTQNTNNQGLATFRNVPAGMHTISAPANVTVGGSAHNFSRWSDDPSAGATRNYNVQRSDILAAYYVTGGPTGPGGRPGAPGPAHPPRGAGSGGAPPGGGGPAGPGPTTGGGGGTAPTGPGPAPTIPPTSGPNIRIWGLIEETYPNGHRPLPGARVRIVRRGGLGGFGRFFGRPHGNEIPSVDPSDPNSNGISGNDGKYDYRAWIDPNETPLIVNIVASRDQFEEHSEIWEIPNLIPRRRPIRSPMTGTIIGYEDVPSTTEQSKNFTLNPTGRARKSRPTREAVRGEFYQNFGWGSLPYIILFSLVLIALYWWLGPQLLGTFGLEFSPLFRWGGTIAILLFVILSYRSKQTWGILKPLLPFIILFVLVWGVLGLKHWSDLTNFDWYINRVDLLKIIGVPQDTINNMKDGIRNVLSFLQFKGAEPTKPEAKKIGGFEAIELKFGSKYNNFILPTLFARMDYSLPITVTNPNKFDTKLVVENFNIIDVFLNNRSDNRILCGSIGKGATVTGRIELGDVNPEGEEMTTIEFKGKTLNDLDEVPGPDGEKIDCKIALGKYKDPVPTNPMYPAKIKKSVPNDDECKEDKNTQPPIENDQVCKAILNDFYKRYSISAAAISTSADVEAKYIKSEGMCECTLNRYYNIMDNLCFMDNDKAKITLTSSYGFKVQGKGELILVKTEADRKLAPKPSITSSAGPLTVTTYFVSDVHVPEKTRTSIMFIQITNDGDGSAQINDIIIDYQKPPPKISGLTIEKCSPMPDKSKNVKIFISKDGTTISCPVKIIDATIVNSITGSYLTVPVIVDVDYTYSQTHSTTINVKKETIPEGVTDPDQIKELDANFKPLPYYCPNEKSETYGTTSALKIYDVK